MRAASPQGSQKIEARTIVRALQWCIRAALVALLSVGVGGCDRLLLANPPPADGIDGGAVSADEPLTRDDHIRYFPIDDASHHSAQVCTDCHADPDTFATFTCQSCHAHAPDVAPTRHVDITGFVNQSSSCIACHPTGGEAPISLADHSAKYFTIDTGSHASLACSDCHTDRTTSKTFVCITCHTQTDSAAEHAGNASYVWTDAGCYSCHTS